MTTEEKAFLTRSKLRAQTKVTLVVLSFIVVVVVLIWFVVYYRSNNIKIEQVNNQLTASQDSLKSVNNSLGIRLEELRVKDSIHESLTERIGNDQQIIKMTNKELQDALNELYILNEKLKESKRKVERERDGLKTDKQALTERLKEQINKQDKIIKEKLSEVEQSQKLSQRANTILNSTETPTEAQYKEAFQLARYAWEMSRSNSQAMDVLNQINNSKMRKRNSGFLGKNRPKNTYTYRQIEDMIQKIDQKYKYGKLTNKEVQKVLRSGS